MQNVVLVIDWQNEYFERRKSSKYMDGAVQKTARIIETARARGDIICWVAFSSHKDVFNKGAKSFHPALVAVHNEDDPLFIKNTFDAFSNKDFEKWLTQTDFEKLIFTGFHISDCVQATYKTAVKKGLGGQIVLVRDACGPEPMNGWSKRRSIKDADMFIQIGLMGGTVCSAARLVDHLQNGRPLKQIPYRPAKPPYLLSYGSRGCEFKDAVIEMNSPQDVLTDYVATLKIFKKGDYPSKRLLEICNPVFMDMWARVNGISQDDLQKIAKNPYDAAAIKKLHDALTPHPA